MSDLRTTIGGIELKNPFAIASQAPCSNLTPQEQADKLARYAQKGASAVITHFTTTKRVKDPSRGPIRARSTFVASKPPFGKEGFFLVCSTTDVVAYLDYQLEMLEHLKKLVDVPIIGNIIGNGVDEKSWTETAKEIVNAGCVAIELNVSCSDTDNPIVEDWQSKILLEGGYLVGQVPNLVKKITRAVVDSVDVPIFVKMTPEVGYPGLIEIAKAIEEGGANGVTLINSPVSIAPPDIYRGGKPKFPIMDNWTFSGTYGPWDRFLTYKYIAAVAKFVPSLDINAVGGNVDPEHSIEFMMLGAKAIQLSSALLWRGDTIISKNIRFLEKFMEEMNYESVNDIIGAALEYISTDKAEVTFKPAHAVVDDALCDGCGKCTRVLCTAMKLEDNVAMNDVEKCSACGFCILVCPTGAISIQPV